MTFLPSVARSLGFDPSAPRGSRRGFRGILGLASALALAGGAAAAPVVQDDPIPPIQEEGDSYVINFAESSQPDEGISLAEFVKICQEATGKNFTYLDDTETLLANQQVRMFGTKRIPKRDFYSFFQIMMFIHQYACISVGPPHLEVTVVQSLTQQAGRSNIKANAIYVLPEQLEDFADQPATLITTVVTLDNVDVRQLATSLRPLMPDQSTQSMLNAGNTNSLVLTGFGSNIVHLARLLRIVDDASRIDEEVLPQFAVVPLEFASADDIAELIDQLLEASRSVVEQQRRNEAQAQGVSGRLGAGQGEAEILTYPRTNSLLVMALPEDMPRIKDLIAQLDVDIIEPERNYHIYTLENVSAEEVADVLDEFLRDASRIADQGQAGGRPAQGGGGGTSNDNEVVVVPDPGTNSLLIAAGKTRYQEVLDLITQLDQRQDQVLIETALIELSGSDTFDLVVDLLGGDLLTNQEEVGGWIGGSAFGATPSFDFIQGDPITGTVSAQGAPTGLTAAFIDSDNFIPILIRTLQTRQDTNVLNIPSVLVNNNGSATVRTLDERPTTQVTTTGGVGNAQTNFAGYEPSGIIMQISPSISASRYLRLGIELEVSTFGAALVSDLSIPPPRVTRTIITEVNVPDGDTMVIGGIVVDNERGSEDQVPLLGDLPLIGNLFKGQSRSSERTTLYFFVTPHILHDKDFADLAEISYEKKINAAAIMGRDRLNMVDPQFGVTEESSGLEGFEIPLYRSPEFGEVSPEDVGLDPMRNEQLFEGAREYGDDDADTGAVPPTEPVDEAAAPPTEPNETP